MKYHETFALILYYVDIYPHQRTTLGENMKNRETFKLICYYYDMKNIGWKYEWLWSPLLLLILLLANEQNQVRIGKIMKPFQ